MSSTDMRLATVLAFLMALPAQAAPPLSSSDWLSGGPVPPAPVSAWRPGDPKPFDALRRPQRSPITPEGPPVAETAAVDPVGVTRLDGPDADRVGLQSAQRAGLPSDLWAGVPADEAARAIADAAPRLPAMSQLFRRILTAQLEPPTSADDGKDVLFLARIDRLLDLGDVTAAMSLLDAAGPGDAARFRRRFAAGLLLDRVDGACAELPRVRDSTPDMAARVFCLARGGDWATAALSLQGAVGMGLIEPGPAARLGAFLDDAQVDAGDQLELPDTITPLDFRLLEAIGQPLPTSALPLAFAVTDLVSESGVKPRLEAAERLARAGSLSPQRLRALYTEQPPAASGGVWERVRAVQRLDAAVAQDDHAAVTEALPQAIAAMAEAGLAHALGGMLGKQLAGMQLDGKAGKLALWLALIGGSPPDAASSANDPEDAWLLALSRGEPVGQAGAPAGGLDGAVAAALTGDRPSPPPGATGPLLLGAMADTDAGLDGDLARAAAGITALRALGQEGSARAAAMQLILLPRLQAVRG